MKYIFTFLFYCLFLFPFTVQANANVIYWGVYHPTPGEIPVGNVTDDYLLKFDTFYHGFADGEKVLFLTFDAGYEDGNTIKILDVLKERRIPAAFFLTGNYMKDNPEMVKRMVSDGHIIGNHTMTHPDIYKLSPCDFMLELRNAEDIYREITGLEMPRYFRPPSCAFDEASLIAAKEKGYQTILWSLAYDDWQNKQPAHDEAFNRIIPNLHPGAYILLHTTSTTNAAIMADLIIKIQEEGYIFRCLDE